MMSCSVVCWRWFRRQHTTAAILSECNQQTFYFFAVKKTEQFYFFLITVIIATSCNSKNGQDKFVNSSEKFDNTTTFYKKFKGSYNGTPLAITLIRYSTMGKPDSMLTCVIDSLNEGPPAEGNASIDAAGNFEINCSINDTAWGVLFKGNFVTAAAIQITSIKNKPVSGFELKQLEEEITITPLSFYNEEPASSAKKQADEIDCDSHISLHTLRFKTKGNTVNVDKLNAAVDNYFIRETKAKNIEQFVKENIPLGTNDVTMQIRYMGNHFVTLAMNWEEYGCGAAHPQNGIYFINYDLVADSSLAITDIVPAKNMPTLEQEAKQRFEKKYGKDYESFTKFFLPPDFAVLQSGLLFFFRYYEFGSFAGGNMDILIPYDHISNILSERFKKQMLQ